jgi:hypothetical protein
MKKPDYPMEEAWLDKGYESASMWLQRFKMLTNIETEEYPFLTTHPDDLEALLKRGLRDHFLSCAPLSEQAEIVSIYTRLANDRKYATLGLEKAMEEYKDSDNSYWHVRIFADTLAEEQLTQYVVEQSIACKDNSYDFRKICNVLLDPSVLPAMVVFADFDTRESRRIMPWRRPRKGVDDRSSCRFCRTITIVPDGPFGEFGLLMLNLIWFAGFQSMGELAWARRITLWYLLHLKGHRFENLQGILHEPFVKRCTRLCSERRITATGTMHLLPKGRNCLITYRNKPPYNFA